MTRSPGALVLTLLLALPAAAQDKQDSPDSLKARVEKLEAENAAMKKELAALKQQLEALAKGPGAKEAKPAPEEEKVKQAGKGFVEDLEKDRLASAYRATTAAYQKRTERKAFDELVEKSPEVRSLSTFEQSRQEKVRRVAADKDYEYYFTGLHLGTGPHLGNNRLVNIALKLVEEGGEWKVDDVEIRVGK
jgi:hypothetical protein